MRGSLSASAARISPRSGVRTARRVRARWRTMRLPGRSGGALSRNLRTRDSPPSCPRARRAPDTRQHGAQVPPAQHARGGRRLRAIVHGLRAWRDRRRSPGEVAPVQAIIAEFVPPQVSKGNCPLRVRVSTLVFEREKGLGIRAPIPPRLGIRVRGRFVYSPAERRATRRSPRWRMSRSPSPST